jgi:hypothetical protein
MEEEGTHMFVQFGCGAFPSSAGVDVDHCLIEIYSEKVYFYCVTMISWRNQSSLVDRGHFFYHHALDSTLTID